jgi:hypothetical protein
MQQLNLLKNSQREEVRAILRRAKAKNLVGARFLRGRGTDRLGRPFTGLLKATIWLNAATIKGKDIALWRQDPCGALMYWHDYGRTNSKHGWEIDHILPVASGGTDDTTNLQALHWKNNRQKANDIGVNYCVVTD